jgi:hypothetical protein
VDRVTDPGNGQRELIDEPQLLARLATLMR